MEPTAATKNHQSNGNYYIYHNNNGTENDVVSWFEGVAENAGWVQTQILRRILELNYGTEYLKKWLGDIEIHEVEGCALEKLYTSLVPLSTHADLEPLIQRVADGDTGPVLTQKPIATLSLR